MPNNFNSLRCKKCQYQKVFCAPAAEGLASEARHSFWMSKHEDTERFVSSAGKALHYKGSWICVCARLGLSPVDCYDATCMLIVGFVRVSATIAGMATNVVAWLCSVSNVGRCQVPSRGAEFCDPNWGLHARIPSQKERDQSATWLVLTQNRVSTDDMR